MRNKKYFLSLIFVFTMLLVVSLLVGCANRDGDANNERVFVFVSDYHYPPFGFFDPETQAFTGIDIELLTLIAEDQSFLFEVRNIGFAAAMGAVQAGQADAMMAAMTITDVRRETFDFSDGYFRTGQVMLTAYGSAIRSFEDIAGQVVAAKIGTVGTIIAEEIAEEYGASILYFEDTPTMFTAIIQGNAVAGFEDYPAVQWAIANDLPLRIVGEIINPAYYGIAVRRGFNSELIEMFNAGLANLRESGVYYEILARWGMD